MACRWIICCCTASKLLPLLQPPFAGGTEGSSRRLSFTDTVESRTKEFGGWIFSHHQLINWKKAGIINATKFPKLSHCRSISRFIWESFYLQCDFFHFLAILWMMWPNNIWLIDQLGSTGKRVNFFIASVIYWVMVYFSTNMQFCPWVFWLNSFEMWKI